jgi:hypothetical protein
MKPTGMLKMNLIRVIKGKNDLGLAELLIIEI